ncbi:MAG TPA: DNA polymerase III subunit gamma/tau [Actinomycetota bacterium]|nr:DNA polymerase III subunit gamma/tau [Actinomycetota bacterium]
MAHLSLYRKYRSQTFADVVGQEHVTKTLKRAVEEDRVAHAYLFSGPRGTGKTSSARILAKSLNCEKQLIEPCNECASCIAITEGSSLDVVEIDAASHGSVDDARDLRERVAYASVSGRWKVYIIDECHMLSSAANNALLKVLEEPPSHVVFVFATTEPHKVLQTVLDRCQRYEFRPIGSHDIADHLISVCESEGIAIDEDAAMLIAGRATGSMRDALSLVDQLTSYAGQRIGPDEVAQMLGNLPEDILFEAVDLISERDIGAAFVFTDRMISSGTDAREFTRALVEHLRSLFLIQHAPSAQEILDLTDEQLERLRAQSNRIEGPELLRLIDLANETQLQLRQSVDGRLALEVSFARMTRPELHATGPAVLSRIQRLERLAGIEEESLPVPAAQPVSQAPRVPQPDAPSPRSAAPRPKPKEVPPANKAGLRQPAAASAVSPSKSAQVTNKVPQEPSGFTDGDIDLEKIIRAWPLVIEKVKRRKISLQAFLIPAKPGGWSDGELVLEFRPDSTFHQKNVSDPKQHGPLLEAFHEVFGVMPRLRCVLGAEAPKVAPSRIDDPKPEELSDDNVEAPAAKSRDAIDLIRETFGGTEVVEEA